MAFPCPNLYCIKKYKSRQALHNHLKYECGVEPQFKCSSCSKYFKQRGNFRSHMISVHGILEHGN